MTADPHWLQHLDEPRQLASGRWSRWYVDANALWEHEPTREMIVAYFVAQLLGNPVEYHFRPVPTGGNVWAKALRVAMPEPLYEGRKTIVVEDVTTTGRSALLLHTQLYSHILAVVARGDFEPDYCWARLHLPDYATEEEAR